MHQDRIRTRRNDQMRNRLKSTIKILKKALATKQTKDFSEMLRNTYSVIDMAFKKGLLKRNTAARRKSLVARMVNAANKPAEEVK